MHTAMGIKQKELFLCKLILEANEEVINSQAYYGFKLDGTKASGLLVFTKVFSKGKRFGAFKAIKIVFNCNI